MKRGFKVLLVVIVLGLLGVGFYLFFNPKKALNIILPEGEKLNNIHVNFSNDTAYITLETYIKNKSIFKLNLDSLVYKVKLDTATLLSKSQFLDEKLKRSESDTLDLVIALPYKRLSKKIKSLQNRDSVDIDLELRLIYSTIFGETSLPYQKTIRIEVPKPPKFEIEKIEYLRREKKTGYFMAYIRMHNYGKIDLNITKLHYQMTVTNFLKAEGDHPEEIRIKPKTDLLFKLTVKVEFKSIFKTISKIITNNDQVDYNIKVTGLVQNNKLSKDKTPIELEKSGTMELKK